MALFGGTSGDSSKRPLGPRPFSGSGSSSRSPLTRPAISPRRHTAAPFTTVREELNAPAPVVLETPATPAADPAPAPESLAFEAPSFEVTPEAPALEAAEAVEAHHAPVVDGPASVLNIDDLRPTEDPTWEAAVQPQQQEEVAEFSSLDFGPAAAASEAEEPAVEEPAGEAPRWEPAVEQESSLLAEAEVELTAPEAPVIDEAAPAWEPEATLEPAEASLDIEPLTEAPTFEALEDEDRSEANFEAFAGDAPPAADPVESEFQETGTSQDVEPGTWQGTADTSEAWTGADVEQAAMPTDFAGDEPQWTTPAAGADKEVDAEHVAWHSGEYWSAAAAVPSPVVEPGAETPGRQASSLEVEPSSPVAAQEGEGVSAASMEAGTPAPEAWPGAADAAARPVEAEAGQAPVVGMPDESTWRDADAASEAPDVVAGAPATGSGPMDASGLEMLVRETRGEERAVEVLEAVARMVRSREIVVSVDAGAPPAAILASVLASLLSHPS